MCHLGFVGGAKQLASSNSSEGFATEAGFADAIAEAAQARKARQKGCFETFSDMGTGAQGGR